MFLATIDNVEKRTTRDIVGSKDKGGVELALLPKKTKGGAVRVLMTVRYGDEKSLQGRAFLGSVVPSMLLRGSKKHTFQQMKDEFDRLKAEVNFGGSNEPGVAQVRIKTMRDSLPAVLSLVIEALREPAFPKPEFETLRKELLARYEEQLQDPVRNGMTTLMQKVTPAPKTDVRYILSMAERIEALKKLTVADLSRLHKSLWGASATQVAVVGDFDPAAIKEQLEKELVPWKSPKAYARITQPYKPGLVEEATVNTPDKQMSLVAVGHPLEVRDDDPDYPTLVLLNHVLGGSASSRLLNRLRQKEGLSYGAFSDIDARPLDKSGIFFAGAICAPENANKAMALMLEEITKLQKEGISAQELADAKKSYAANFDTMLADDDFVARRADQGPVPGPHLRLLEEAERPHPDADRRRPAGRRPEVHQARQAGEGEGGRPVQVSHRQGVVAVESSRLFGLGADQPAATGNVRGRLGDNRDVPVGLQHRPAYLFQPIQTHPAHLGEDLVRGDAFAIHGGVQQAAVGDQHRRIALQDGFQLLAAVAEQRGQEHQQHQGGNPDQRVGHREIVAHQGLRHQLGNQQKADELDWRQLAELSLSH